MKDQQEKGGLNRRILRSNWDLLATVTTDQQKGLPMPEVQKPERESATAVDLPAAEGTGLGDRPFRDVAVERKSRRKYSDEPLSLSELSYLLWATQGVRRVSSGHTMRMVPSAGARHPFETYVFASRVETVHEGLYRYLPLRHRLALESDRAGLADDLRAGLHGQSWNCSAVFVWTAVPDRSEWRYAGASYKLIALDAGHLCQNLYLACESIGCGACAIGAYDQDAMDGVVGVDGDNELVVYAAVVGHVQE